MATCRFDHAHPPEPIMRAAFNPNPYGPQHCPACHEAQLTRGDRVPSYWVTEDADEDGEFCAECFPGASAPPA